MNALVAPESLPTPSLLFCPADRPDRYAKALAVADVVVLDLEDAVAAPRKSDARTALIQTPLDARRVIVRVNPSGTPDHAHDLEALKRTSYRRVMLAKTESREQVEALRYWQVIALCETPAGVLEAGRIAAADSVIALMWGAEDLVAAMSGRSSRHASGSYRDVALFARSSVLLAAKANGRLAIDGVFVDFGDKQGLAAEARDAAESGFDLKACIHPSQVEVVIEAYRPTAPQLEHARRVVEATRDGGVARVDGQMVDGPLIRQARQTLSWLDRPRRSRSGR
jgi:citrate lyase subunit beta/citryl-CoA lyase